MQISKIIISLFATFVVVSCGPTCIPSESNYYCIGVSITEATMSTRDSTLQSIDWRLLSAMSVVKCLDRIDSSWTQRLDQEGHNSVAMFTQNIRLELIESEYQSEKGSDDHLIKIFEKNVNEK
ncbi:hypothetical protein DFH28DRAFT_1110462 [Melampsora americana]|nr:hypothetical protein DFH28DRAFT_1110462 [Melampsora americana]